MSLINIFDVRLVQPGVAVAAHRPPDMKWKHRRKFRDYIPFVEVHVDEICIGYNVAFERRVYEDGTPNLDPLAYQIRERSPVAMAHKYVARFYESGQGFSDAFVQPRKQPYE